MLRHHFRQILRLFQKDKVNFGLNLGGLALGLAAVLLSFVFIQDERSFDAIHKKKERIYRICNDKRDNSPNGDPHKTADTPGKMAGVLMNNYPEVAIATRVMPWWEEVLVTRQQTKEYAKNWTFVDSSFFELFDFEVVRGAGKKTLMVPGRVLLSESMAVKLFGSEDPIGKTFTGLSNLTYTVGGIVQDPPRTSHLRYDILAAWSTTEAGVLGFNWMNNWLGQTVYTYVLLNNSTQAPQLNRKLSGLVEQHMPKRADRYHFYLQPLSEVYLQSDDLRYLRGGIYGSESFLTTFWIISLLILFIACFNYINITTSRALFRAKEVGVRKVFGASKHQLLGQFLTETFLLVTLAGLLALLIGWAFLPVMNDWFEKSVPATLFVSFSAIVFLGMLVALTSLVAGYFPAFLLARFRPAGIIRNSLRLAPGGSLPRQFLTTLQLTISTGLIIGVLILSQQFRFLLTKDMGFDQEHVLTLKTPPGIDSNHVAFRTELSALAGVTSISMCQASVGSGTFGTTAIPEGNHGEEMPIQIFRVDTTYLETFGMEMVEGRYFSSDFPADLNQGSIVVNEALVNQMGWESGIGKTIRFSREEPPIPVVGVIRDFHFSSLREPIVPLVMHLDSRRTNIAIRFEPAHLTTLLSTLEKNWYHFEARYPFEYEFLEESFASKYRAEQRMLKTISLFTVLAIVIACLGLYGLTTFAINRRKKEIAVRKVLGATTQGVVTLLVRNYIQLMVIAFLLALPIAWYLLNKWLMNFAYHIHISWWVPLIAASLLAGIVLLTVGGQSLGAALTSPSKGLRED